MAKPKKTKQAPKPKTIHQLTKEYQKSLFNILKSAETINEQHEIMKHMVSTFSAIGKEKGVPDTLNLAVELIRKKFPDLVPDMDRLLLLID